MISDKKKLEIANVCYANVSGLFATHSNPNFREENFTWDSFIENCEKNADLWLILAATKGKKKEINELAKIYAKEIAKRLVWHATRQETLF